jgi:hypothetical protein
LFKVHLITAISTEICLSQIELQELYFSGHWHFHAIHTQVIIDNAGYICYAEARCLGHQNDAKQFIMMQQIGVNGLLHFLENCILLAYQIYPNRHPTVTLITKQQINRKSEHMRDRSIFIRLLGRCIGILGTYFFSCIRPQGK